MIRVHVNDIKPDGLEISDQMDNDYIGLSGEEYLRFAQPVSIMAKIQKFEDTVLSKIHVEGKIKTHCFRTDKEIEKEWSDDFYIDHEIDKQTQFVELDDEIRQEIILRLPMRVLGETEERQKSKKQETTQMLEEQPKTYKPFKDLEL